MTTFFDTCVLFSVLNDRETHHAWSIAQLELSKGKGPVIISDIVYTEFSVGMDTKNDVDAVITRLALDRFPGNDHVLFRAGKAFKKYRDDHRGQPKDRVIADFLVGAAADVSGAALVTTNPKDFAKYFPALQIIEP